MKNAEFWEKATGGSIRSAVADFIDKTPQVSHLENEDYYSFEDALVDFIQNIKEQVYRERDREYLRDDVQARIEESLGAYGDIIIDAVPLKEIDIIANEWNEELDNYELYWDSVWESLDTTLSNRTYLEGMPDSEEDAWLYAAYLNEWFTNHKPEPFSLHHSPLSLEEFLDEEMSNQEAAEHYSDLARKFKNEHPRHEYTYSFSH